jgi:hypothetical protein
MSAKGISWIEANFEKLIVVIMLLAFLVVLIFQFVLQSSAVEVGGNKVPLADAYKPAERAAERLQSQINDPNPTLPEAIETRDLASEFERAISGGVVDTGEFLAIAEPLELEVSGDQTNYAAGEFAAFEPPAPAKLTAASYRATLDPYAVEQIEGLAEYLPTEQPFDTPWNSVQASFDGTALKAAYEHDPDGPSGSVSPLPRNWWSQGVGVLAIETERQKRELDGSWGPAETVAQMPGTLSLLEDLDEIATNYRQLESIGSQAARNEDVILRPQFVSILEGESWVPPAEVPDPSEVGGIKNQIRTLERRLASIDRDIERKEAAKTNAPERTSGRETGGREGGREGGENRRPTRQPENDQNQVDPRIAALDRQIESLNTQREAVVEQLTDLGWQPEDQVGVAEAYDITKYTHEEPILEADEVSFWVHDLDVEAGATYRYRTRLVFVNPLFGRKSSLSESLHELADAKLVRSDWSEWSEPVGVSWDEYFFLTSANPGDIGNIGKASVTAELYKFYYGYWRKSEVALEPGDRFVAEIELPEGLQTWDVEREASAQAWKPAAVGTDGTEAEVEQVEGLDKQLLPTKLPISADAWLLDVVSSPVAGVGIGGQSTSNYEAFVRGPDGLIVSRSPSLDAKEPLLAVIKASSELGADQLPRIPGQAPRQPFRGDPGPAGREFNERDGRRMHGQPGGGGGGGGFGGG